MMAWLYQGDDVALPVLVSLVLIRSVTLPVAVPVKTTVLPTAAPAVKPVKAPVKAPVPLTTVPVA